MMKTFLFFLILFCFFPSMLTNSTCIEAKSNSRVLPTAFFVPATLLISIGILMWFLCFRQKYNEYKLKSLDNLKFKKPIPQGTFNYSWHYFSDHTVGCFIGWISNDKTDFSLTFNDTLITGEGINEKNQGFILDGKIEDNKKISLKTVSGGRDEMTLYLTEVPNSEKPGFVGFWKREKAEGFWAMFPKELNLEIIKLFPYMNSKILRIYVGLIIFFSLLCLITFAIARTNGFYDYYYTDYIVGYPWGAFTSFIGLFFMLILANPFNFQCKKENMFVGFVLIIILFSISIVCLVFSVFDMTVADFLMTETLMDTKNSYQLEYAKIAETCHFQEYGCSIVWYGNYTMKNDSCLNSYSVDCVSFEPNQESCSNGRQIVYDILLVEALFQFFLWVFWTLTYFLFIELLTSDRWPAIEIRLREWNQKKPNIEKEMNDKEHFFLNKI